MEVFYKFKSAKDYDSLSIDWHYTTVSDVKDYLVEKKCSGKRNKAHYDNLFLYNADTPNQEYLDGDTLIPKHTFLIVRRAPRCICLPIVVNPPPVIIPEQEDELKEENIFDLPSVSWYPKESEWVEFWNDLSPSEVVAPLQDVPCNKVDEDSKIRDLIDTPNPSGRAFGRGFRRGGLSDQILPPPGYICHRCKVLGHFIQHCPTNGDPAYDIKRTKPPTGIPNSMLVVSPDGSYALPGGGVAVLKPNEAAFEKEIQGIPSTRSVVVLPAELHCPLCNLVMKDAVLASKCCFKSFCDKCIREYIISKSLCTCGATNVLADDLIPNKTLRSTIVRMLGSSYSTGAHGSSAFQAQDMESAPCPQAKIPCSKVASPTLSAPSKGVVLAPKSEVKLEVEEMTEAVEEADNVAHETLGKVIAGQGVEVSEAAHECMREPGSQMYPLATDKEKQKKPISGIIEKKEKKLADMQPRPHQDFADMPVKSSGYNPYCKQPTFDGFGQPYSGQMPFMGYGLGPTSISFGAAFHHNPFGAQMMPIPPQRDLAKFETDFNGGGAPPLMSTSSPELIRTSSKRKVRHDDDDYKQHPHQPRKKERLHHHRSESELVSATRLPILPVDRIYESSDDERNFKRLPSKYESSPAPAVVKGRHSSRGWRAKGVTAASISRLSVY